jgi:outer membrane protein OmpA-like peptidoglycan-associated protein
MSSDHRGGRHPSIGSVVLASGLAAAMSVALAPGEARGQSQTPIQATNGDGYDLRLFRPAVDSKGQFVVNGTDILGAWDLAFGLVVDYGRDLARIGAPEMAGGNNRALVANMFNATFLANVGLFNWLVVGVQVPVHLLDGPSGDIGVAGYRAPQMGSLYQGFGDVAFNLKLRLLRSELTHFGAAVILQASVPTGSSRSFAGEPGATLWPQLALEWRPHRVFRVDLNAGYRHLFGRGSQLPQGAGTTYDSSLTAGLGFSVRVIPVMDLVAETYMQNYTNDIGRGAAMPWEAVGGIKVFVQRNSYLMLGAGTRIPVGDALAAANLRAFIGIVFEPSIGDTDGDGYRDDVDRCPTQPEDFDLWQDADGCPEPDNDNDGLLDAQDACPNVPEDRDGDHDEDGCPEGDEGDRDGDGILDRVDQCPDQPEDRDQFQDQDGCPDPDNDQDSILDTDDLCPNDAEDRDNFEDQNGCPEPDNDRDRIPDQRDRCPNDPETYNGTDDEDGCPDTGQVVVEEGQIRILQAINFETNSARIRPDSVPIVEAVARTLIGNPQIELVEVQGHADERGNDEHNLRLTQDRAASVVEALVERGVQRSRLHSAGYGEYCRAGYPATPGQPPLNAECQHGGPRWCHSERAWRLDRRVVFLILRTSDGPTNVRIACPEGEHLIPEEDRQYHNPNR